MNHHWPFLWLFNDVFLAQLSHHSLLDEHPTVISAVLEV